MSGREQRTKIPNKKLQDFVTHTVGKKKSSSTQAPVSTSSSGTPYPITHYVSCEKFSDKHRRFLEAITAGNPPKFFKEAMKHERWREAMGAEMQALEDQDTWELQPLPPGKKALRSKWVYTKKYDEKRNLQKLKARLVIFGHHQVEGVDL